MKIFWQTLILFCFVACSENEPGGPDGGPVELPEREVTDIQCPVHEVPVYKIHASYATVCYVWDPKSGLTVEQIRNRFPYAIWDANLHRVDESEGAKFPRYNLVCERCQDNWGEYATEQIPLQKQPQLEIHISTSGEVRIKDARFEFDQLTAIAKAASELNAEARVIFRAHKETPTDAIRRVVTAVEEGGLHDFIFGSYVAERNSPRKPEANTTRHSRPDRRESK